MFGRLMTSLGLGMSLIGLVVLMASARALAAEPTKADRLELSPPTKFQGYRDWKSEKIALSAEKIRSLKAKLAQAKAGPLEARKALEQDLSQEEWRLSIAKELTVKDYMILHIASFPASTSQRFQEIAALLSKEEVAQILEAYVQMINPTQGNLPQLRVQALSNER